MSDSNFKTVMIVLVIIIIAVILFAPYNKGSSQPQKETFKVKETFIDDSIKPENTIFKGTIMKDYENPKISRPNNDMLMNELAFQISPQHETHLNINSVVVSTSEDDQDFEKPVLADGSNSMDANGSEESEMSNVSDKIHIEDITDIPFTYDDNMNNMIRDKPLLKMYIEDPIAARFRNTPLGTMNENPNNKDNKGMPEVELTGLINKYRNDTLDSIQGADYRNRYVFKNFPMYGRVYY